MKVQAGRGELFRADWTRAINEAALQGASAGTVRALTAYADADVVDTIATIEETTHVRGPVDGMSIYLAWRQWHPEYTRSEVARLLPELATRWPGERAKRVAAADRRARDRWCSNGEDILNAVAKSGGVAMAGVVRNRLGMGFERFDKVVKTLVSIEALHVRGNRLIATLDSELARRQLRDRWLND